MNLRKSPLSYLLLAHTVFVGFAYTTGFPADVKITLLWKLGVVGGLPAWGLLMMISGVSALVAVALGPRAYLVAMGVLALNFSLWSFATVSYWSVDAYLAVFNYSAFHMAATLCLFASLARSRFQLLNTVLILNRPDPTLIRDLRDLKGEG